MKVATTLLLACLIATASAADFGYNYQNIEPKVSESTHHAVHTSHTTHDDGYQKHFYYFNAPEEHIDHGKALQKVVSQSKKNLQVIFIKPPEQKIHKKPTVQNVAKNVVEEKTHIYVLSKEPDHAAIAKKVQMIQQASVHHHKQDVHFVKYHTPAEAHHIQESIIQQHGGKPSEIVHSGSAPVVNFASSSSGSSTDHHHGSPSVSREYLAPKPATTSVVI